VVSAVDELVLFSAQDSWQGPANWAQRAFHDSLDQDGDQGAGGRQLITTPIWEVAPGTTPAQVRAWLSDLVERHQALRTRVDRSATRDDEACLTQTVTDRGQIPVAWVDAGDRLDPATESSIARYLIDLHGDEPFRVTVLSVQGWPRRIIGCASLRTLDASSVSLLRDHGPNRPRPRSGTWTPEGNQPRDQVVLEAGDRYLALSRRAADFWQARLQRSDLPFAGRPTAGHWYQAAIISTRARAQLDELAARYAVPSSAVVSAVIALMASVVLDRQDVPLRLVTSNRHLTGRSSFVGVLAQWAPAVFDIDPGGRFGALVTACSREALLARRHAVWSPAELSAALGAGEGSDPVGGTLTINDARGLAPGAGADPRLVDALQPLTRWPYQGGRCAVAVTGQDRIQFAIRAYSGHLSQVRGEQLLLGLPTLLSTAASAAGDATIADLTRSLPPSGQGDPVGAVGAGTAGPGEWR
jgi:hypothetical protein